MNKKQVIIISLVLVILFILTGSIAYYSIVVNGNISGTVGKAIFNLKDGNNNDLSNKTIALNNGNKVNPGDSGSFSITIDASGSSTDMYATLEIERINLPTNLKFYLTSDKKSELHKYYSFLEYNGTTSETLTIYWYWNPYIDDEEDSKFINVDTLEASINVSAYQLNSYAIMKNGFIDIDNETNSVEGTEFWTDNYRPYIRTIKFDNDLTYLPADCTEENLCFDVTQENSQEKVYGYLTDSTYKDATNSKQILYDLHIVSEAPIFAPVNSRNLFAYFTNLVEIDFNNNFNTSNVLSMSTMFKNCEKLQSLDLSTFNTSKTYHMNSMFEQCKLLETLDISNFNTQNLDNTGAMFNGCDVLVNLDLSSFNTSNVTTMGYMFCDCKALETLNLDSFNTSNVTDMMAMFMNCQALSKLDLGGFNTSKVTLMNFMFYTCSSLETLNIDNFNTLNVTRMDYMFSSCSKLGSLNISNFNTSSVTSMNYMFYYCERLITTINIMNSNLESFNSIFKHASLYDGTKIVVNYINAASEVVDNMIATKSDNGNVVKGTQI